MIVMIYNLTRWSPYKIASKLQFRVVRFQPMYHATFANGTNRATQTYQYKATGAYCILN